MKQPQPHPEGPIKPAGNLTDLIHERSPELLRQAASDRRMTEELALTLLERRDLPGIVIEDLSRNGVAMKHRKVINAIVLHPRTPRHCSLPIARRLFNFELMAISLTPAVAADLKMFAEETLVSRVETISSGERLTLAKRGSTRLAAALLLDSEERVIAAALENPYLTEAWIVKAILNPKSSQELVNSVCRHKKWSLRRDIQVSLLKSEKTPLARAVALADGMSSAALREVLRTSRLPKNVKDYLLKILELRTQAAAK